MRNILQAITFSIFLANTISLSAQLSEGGFPISGGESVLKKSVSIPIIEMPGFDLEKEQTIQPKCGNKFAHKFLTDISIKEEGVKTFQNDKNIWRLAIKSADAYSINLIFKNFQVPEGARLFLYSRNKEQILGAYTSRNNTSGKFAITPIDGDEIVVEYEEPASSALKADLTIESVNHDYRNLKALPSYGASELCQVDAANDTLHLTKGSACLLLINGQTFCSGNLINNTANDGNPYIMSSGHCFWNTDARGATFLDTTTAQTTIAFFNYEAPNANWPIEGSREMSLSGGKTIASRKSHDMLLIRMNEAPPIDYRTYYAGWNREKTIQGPVYVFHHPQGDTKKISTDDATPSTKSFDNGITFKNNIHWRIYRWDTGMTEGGSSGSGLFDNNDLLVGGLTGGDTASNCSRPGDDFFWKINEVWNDEPNEKNNMGYWLDPLGTKVTICEGRNPYTNPCKRVMNRSSKETPAVADASTKNFAVGTNQEGITEFAEKFTLKQASTLYGIYFYPMIGYYRDLYPVYVRIYKGTDQPDSLIYEQQVRIQTSQLQRRSGSFVNEITRSIGGMENYLRLKEPIQVDSTFFVSFVIPKSGTTTILALNYSEPREKAEDNTAFFLNAKKQWKPFSEHPSIAAPTALMTDVVVKDGWEKDEPLFPVVPETPVDPRDTVEYENDYHFYPTFTYGDLNFDIPKGDELKKIQIVDMNGRTLYIKEDIGAFGHYNLDVSNICPQANTYILVADYKYSSKTYRFLKWTKSN